mgnify:CR=1 FL=1
MASATEARVAQLAPDVDGVSAAATGAIAGAAFVLALAAGRLPPGRRRPEHALADRRSVCRVPNGGEAHNAGSWRTAYSKNERLLNSMRSGAFSRGAPPEARRIAKSFHKSSSSALVR